MPLGDHPPWAWHRGGLSQPSRTVYRWDMVGGPQLLIILAIALLLFGGSKLPKLARSLGQAQQEFRKGTAEADELPGSPADPKA
jgi:sec-independent protein translocase protein TatA